LQTIRLEIKLGGPDNYEVDMAALAKATGQRTATPPPAVKRYESDSDGEAAPESGMGTDGGGEKKAKKKKKNLGTEHYDLTDPFIDDSELAIDERSSSRRRSSRDSTSSRARSRCSRRNRTGNQSRRNRRYLRPNPSRVQVITRTH